MTRAPSLVAASDADLAENVVVVSLMAGINVGAFAGWLWLLGGP